MVWSHLDPNKTHVAYAVIGVFTVFFSLISAILKEKLYIGESTFASIYGLIVGPHCLNWFSPYSWGNVDYITLEISRMILVVQIFIGAAELPKKYMLVHGPSVLLLLIPVMTVGWLIVGAFIYLIIPGLNYPAALLISGSITATDPVLAAAIIGKSKFAQQKVPGRIRNLLSAESGCNDGLAFPFVYLSLYLIIYRGDAGKIVKNWLCVTILYECIFGSIMGGVIGYFGRKILKFAEKQKWIDKESFSSFFIFLSFLCAGFSSILGTDDLLVAFAAGCAFSWDGWFSKQSHGSHVSSSIDLMINMAYFVYFGSIIPWDQFNNGAIGTNAWRLIIIAIVVLFLRRIPVILALKPIVPDIKTWREALFCGHFGPIGVGGIFACLVAKAELEAFVYGHENVPLTSMPLPGSPYYQLLACMWPVVTFLIVVSIIIHGSSVAFIVSSEHLRKVISSSESIDSFSHVAITKLDDMIVVKDQHGHKSDNEGNNKICHNKYKVDLVIYMYSNSTDEFTISTISDVSQPINAFQEGSTVIIEDADGEILDSVETDPEIIENNKAGAFSGLKNEDRAPDNALFRISTHISFINKSSTHKKNNELIYKDRSSLFIKSLQGKLVRKYEIKISTSDNDSIKEA